MDYFGFKEAIVKIVNLFHGFDSSAISEAEFQYLFDAYEYGATLEDIGTAIVDGTAYDKYFDLEIKEAKH